VHKYLLTAAALGPLVLAPTLTAQQRRARQTPPQRLAAPAQTAKAVYIPFADGERLVTTLAEILPDELKGKGMREVAAAWPAWVTRRDAELRSRLAQGDEDTLVNFLLFGVSYTRRPRVTFDDITRLGRAGPEAPGGEAGRGVARVSRLIEARAEDLVRSLASPGANDRLLFARRVIVEQKGIPIQTAEGRERAKRYLRERLDQVIGENEGYARALEAARLQGDATAEFAERSRLYRERGLSSDTSLLPNFAVEESLKAIKGRGLLAPGGVRRVAVVGPGLDFADKQEGYDFYPQQTIQPFALVDTLLRLGLARAGAVEVTTFDLSPRVNAHLERAVSSARRGRGYTIHLPRGPQARWTPEAVAFWERFGDRVGSPAQPIRLPDGAGAPEVRAVRVRPEVVARVTPVDANVVLQRLELTDSEKFDLIVATNVFVYYDTFDQCLAMVNVERMLRPGGLMLSNNALLELPFFRVRSVGYQTTVYSDRPDDGDHIVWYQRLPE
jgi:hypothetical protein